MKAQRYVVMIGLVAQCAAMHCHAQPALVPDPTFQATFRGADEVRIFDLAEAPDHKWLVRGRFDSVNGTPRTNLTRLNPDGSVDPTFTPAAEMPWGPWPVQDDGKILFGENWGDIRRPATPFNHVLVRLNADGSLDTTFAPPSDVLVFPYVQSILIESNGDILVGGIRFESNGDILEGSLRLNPTGGIEGTLSISGTPLLVNPDGTIMVRTGWGGLVRLKPDGTVDPTFTADVYCPFYDPSRSQRLALDSNGRLLVGAEYGGLYRLNNTGAIDAVLRPAEEGPFEVWVDQLGRAQRSVHRDR
jgi:uncharacterized delta-60 repeat protein